MKRFSDIRKIKVLSNPLKKDNNYIHPNSLDIIKNNSDEKIILSQFFLDNEKKNLDMTVKYNKQQIVRDVNKNMESPDLSLPLTDMLNLYEIDSYDELVEILKKYMAENQNKPEGTIFRLVNLYTRIFYDELNKTNNSLIKIFKIIFPNKNINEEKTKSFLTKWFKDNQLDAFDLNICSDYKKFIKG